MWLINTKTLRLECFIETKIPKYAILSHTWEDEESSFQDFIQQPMKDSARSKKGYDKIKRTCEKARRHHLSYAWVDTCCIDKSSSAELTESINSMFAWYQRADLCYVYLSDLQAGVVIEDHLAGCRWFTRGWTLRELIAPSEARFYNQEWIYTGDRMSFAKQISSITGIQIPVLQGHHGFDNYSVAQRMFWAARRQTTRTEDMAYSLLGIFNVNMPLIYGEGANSFRRLQEAIISRGNDNTIFAWDGGGKEDKVDAQWSLFSPSPSGFAGCSQIQRSDRSLQSEFAITNKGLRFQFFRGVFRLRIGKDSDAAMRTTYVVLVGNSTHKGENIFKYAIPLRKIGANFFRRDGKLFACTKAEWNGQAKYLRFLDDFHIQIDPQVNSQLPGLTIKSVYFPIHGKVHIKEVIPYTLWDEPNRILMTTSFSSYSFCMSAAVVCYVYLGPSPVRVMVCIGKRDRDLICTLFETEKHERHTSLIISHTPAGHQATWHGFDYELSNKIRGHTDTIQIHRQGSMSTVSVRFGEAVEVSRAGAKMYPLIFDVKKEERQASVKNRG